MLQVPVHVKKACPSELGLMCWYIIEDLLMFQSLLVNGAVVHLWSKKSGYNLKIGDHGDVSAKGRNGDYGEH